MRLYNTSFLVWVLITVGVVKAQAPGPTQPGTISSCNKWHVVKSGDTCSSLESTYKISHADFLKWNPDVSSDCLTNFWPDYAYCVAVGTSTTSSTTTKSTSSSATRITSPSGPTQTGIPANCNNWYVVKDGDSCSSVEASFNITHTQFLAWNPVVSTDCLQNFWPTYAYCVGIDPNAPTTRPTTIISPTITSVPVTTTPYSFPNPVTNYTISTPVVPTDWPPTQTQAGQPSYCNDWHLVVAGESCEKIVQDNSAWMGLEDFYAWNPAVGTDCSGLYLNWYVCVGIQPQVQLTVPWDLGFGNGSTGLPPYVSWPPLPEPTVDFNFSPTPTQGPLPTDCQAWYKTAPNDNCRKIVAEHIGITQEQFLAWHPFLNGNCDGLWAENYYCVWAAPEGSLPPVPTVSPQPSPVQAGIISSCKGWYQATALDECDDIVSIFGTFSLEQFVQWNPAVGSTTACKLSADYGYCVAIPSTPTSRTPGAPLPSTTIATTTTSAGGGTAPIATPTPTQSGMTTGCKEFYFVVSGDGCWAIANTAGIDLNDFYLWNPAVKTDCSGLFPDYYVCIGI